MRIQFNFILEGQISGPENHASCQMQEQKHAILITGLRQPQKLFAYKKRKQKCLELVMPTYPCQLLISIHFPIGKEGKLERRN